jgi:hypothetical protein
MPEAGETAKIKLVTLIASSEVQDRLIADLRKLGATGYTISTVSGYGAHGPRTRSLWDSGNVRIETLVPPEIATRILAAVPRGYAGLPILAFAQDVEAVLGDHFAKKPPHA